jgi:hypothetical protein
MMTDKLTLYSIDYIPHLLCNIFRFKNIFLNTVIVINGWEAKNGKCGRKSRE